MVFSFFKKSKSPVAPKLRPRSESRSPAKTIAETEVLLAPELPTLLARAAYFELILFNALSRAAASAPELIQAEGITIVASENISIHHRLTAELVKLGKDPVAEMTVHRAEIDEFVSRIHTSDWYEALLSTHIVGGLVGDMYTILAKQLGDQAGILAEEIRLRQKSEIVPEIIAQYLQENPALADRLALWARRLVGDTILLCRNSVDPKGPADHLDWAVKSMISEIITLHTRRMDALGLTA